MKKITITGVPEHFNYPWLKIIEQQPFLDDGFELVWQEESKGSGAMNKALREGSTDIALVLTESFIKDWIEGNPSKIIGLHIASPLNWGIHLSGKSKEESLDELSEAPFLISRFGSGSHLMAFLLAKQQGWDTNKLKFEVIDNLDGAKKAFGNEEAKMFLWEKYTTKPLVDAGQFKRVGEIPTPWPCFVTVATENSLSENGLIIEKIRDKVYEFASQMVKNDGFSETLSLRYGISHKDIQQWLTQTKWATDNGIAKKDLEETMDILLGLELVERKVEVKQLVDLKYVDLS
ncbi:ABC transporter substrate-binding protein [Belliella sp. DSM 107340]|uniref:ABC transporter substrate-binding protein n=1 Tax=Belliella calami TaxID=2923436 RepID=A0ABS9UIU3_9BACT|nr:ABC transporter substrate-binding protein [Belliella calami]MCH7396433.1 ABC transporter substrate-binding protein [Belliella calami]